MVSLSSVSGVGGALYLEIRRVEMVGEQSGVSYRLTGMVGDGCDEAFIRVELGESMLIEITPILADDMATTLDERIGMVELQRLIGEALTQIYFCVETPPKRRMSGRVTGYADNGRLFQLRDSAHRPHQAPVVVESQPVWNVA